MGEGGAPPPPPPLRAGDPAKGDLIGRFLSLRRTNVAASASASKPPPPSRPATRGPTATADDEGGSKPPPPDGRAEGTAERIVARAAEDDPSRRRKAKTADEIRRGEAPPRPHPRPAPSPPPTEAPKESSRRPRHLLLARLLGRAAGVRGRDRPFECLSLIWDVPVAARSKLGLVLRDRSPAVLLAPELVRVSPDSEVLDRIPEGFRGGGGGVFVAALRWGDDAVRPIATAEEFAECVARAKRRARPRRSVRIEALMVRLWDAAAAASSVADERGGVCRLLTLRMPPGIARKLGMFVRDDEERGMPELASVAPHSPVIDQIPEECREGGYLVAAMGTDKIGYLQPRTADECADLINGSRLVTMTVGDTMRGMTVRMDFLLVTSRDVPTWQPSASLLPSAANGGEKEDEGAGEEGKRTNEEKNGDASEKKENSNSNIPSQPPWVAYQPPQPAAASAAPPQKNSFLDQYKEWQRRNDRAKKQKAQRKCSLQRIRMRAWEQRLEALEQHEREHGHFRVDPSNDSELAIWVTDQRRLRLQNKLVPSKVERLDKIGFPWREDSYPTPSWDEMYESLVRFKGRAGTLPKSGSLHDWIQVQKEGIDRLDSDRVAKLHVRITGR